MALYTITLVKDWVHPASGVKCKAGESFRVAPTLRDELEEGGYISVRKAAPKAAPKKKSK
jgi:hypothetical protein